ncbi:hypothetical protein VTO42DRAFT_9021 [Malbranchea cinnamomea]
MGVLVQDNGCHVVPKHNDLYDGNPTHIHHAPEQPFVSSLSCFSPGCKQQQQLDFSVSTFLLSSPRTSPPRFDFSPNSKAFYTTIKVTTDVAMRPGKSAEEGSQRSESPQTAPCTPPADAEDAQLVKTPKRHEEAKPSTPEPAQKGKAKEGHARTPPSSGKRRRSGSRSRASRSSSTARQRSGHQARCKSGTYSQFQHQRPERDLIAFHRESCRLFESFDNRQASGTQRPLSSSSTHSRPYTEPVDASGQKGAPTRHPPALASGAPPSASPLLHTSQAPISPTQSMASFEPNRQLEHGDPLYPSLHNTAEDVTREQSREYKPVPATVIDWTLPSTRKREYEKIDRSTRGIRGIWRKIAPRWCLADQRTPFYEEGKAGKEYEGSVRRFRMDIPDDDDDDADERHDSNTAGNDGGNGRTSESKIGSSWIERRITAARDQSSKAKSRIGWPGLRRRNTEG